MRLKQVFIQNRARTEAETIPDNKSNEDNTSYTEEQSKSLSIYYSENASLTNKSEGISDRENEDKVSEKSYKDEKNEKKIHNYLDDLE